MGKVFGIIFTALGIWVGLEIFLEGSQNAFGGIFATQQVEGEAPVDTRTAPQRAGDAVRLSQEMDEERRERLMPD